MVDGRRTLRRAGWLARACGVVAFFAGCTALNVARPTPWETHIQASRQAYANGSYSDAESTLLLALGEAEAFGSNDLRLAVTVDALARVYETQNRYAEAEPHYRRALAIREQVLGPAHPDVASTLYRLASSYRAQHRDGDAEPLYRRAVAIWEQARQLSQPDVASAVDNLLSIYDSRGDYAAAAPLYWLRVAIQQQTLGPSHPDLAVTLSKLADIYQAQGRYSSAARLYWSRVSQVPKCVA